MLADTTPPPPMSGECFDSCQSKFPGLSFDIPKWIEWLACLFSCWIDQLLQLLLSILYALQNGIDFLSTFLGSLPLRLYYALLPLLNFLQWMAASFPAWMSCIALFQELLNSVQWLASSLVVWLYNLEVLQDLRNYAQFGRASLDAAILYLPYLTTWLISWGWTIVVNLINTLICWAVQYFLQGLYDSVGIAGYVVNLGWELMNFLWYMTMFFIDLAIREAGMAASLVNTIVVAMQTSVAVDLGIPGPEDIDDPLYPMWQGFHLLDTTVFRTPMSLIVGIAVGFLGLRLMMWTLRQFYDVLPV